MPLKVDWNDLVGKRFNRLTVIGGIRVGKRNLGHMKCDCGKLTTAILCELRNGRKMSCGCYRLEQMARYGDRVTTHGKSKSPTYMSWRAMVWRVDPRNAQDYPYYAGKGVCEEWKGKGGFDRFLADMGERPQGMTLDRIDNAKGYSKDNCRWADRKTQSNNTRRPGKGPASAWMKHPGIYPIQGKWMVRFAYKGVRIYLGRFPTLDAAKRAMDLELLALGYKGE